MAALIGVIALTSLVRPGMRPASRLEGLHRPASPKLRSHVRAVSEEAAAAIRQAALDAELQERRKYERETAAAVALVNRAVHLCRALAEEMDVKESSAHGVELNKNETTLGISTVKGGDSTPVTAADMAIQAFMSDALGKWFPQDAFMGEEDSSELREDAALRAKTRELCGLDEAAMLAAIDRGVEPRPDADLQRSRYWVLDPIDGTKGFVTGQGYIIGLALVDEGRVVAAAMGNPGLQPEPCIMACAAGAGLRYFFADDPSTPARRAQYEVRNTGWARADKGTGDEGAAGAPPWLLSRPMTQGSPLPFGADSPPADLCCGSLVKYWGVASGEFCGFIQYAEELKTWDHAAGFLCVQESGGRVTDMYGGEILFTSRTATISGGVIATAKECDPGTRTRLLESVKAARGAL